MSLERAKAYLKEYKMEDQIKGSRLLGNGGTGGGSAAHGSRADCKDPVFSGGRRRLLIVCRRCRIDNAKYKGIFPCEGEDACAG